MNSQFSVLPLVLVVLLASVAVGYPSTRRPIALLVLVGLLAFAFGAL